MPSTSNGHAQVLGLQRLFLSCSGGQVGEVKARFAFRFLFGWMHELREEWDGGKRETGEGAAGQKRRISQCPVVQMDGVKSTEAVDARHLFGRKMEAIGRLKEGVIGQLEGWVKRYRSRKCFTTHDSYEDSESQRQSAVAVTWKTDR